jgi:hypothetical protein
MHLENTSARNFVLQSPKYGRSPLRTAMRALLMSARSIDAIRRPNRLLVGENPMEAVLDIVVPFLKRSGSPHHDLGTIYVYQMPATTPLFA